MVCVCVCVCVCVWGGGGGVWEVVFEMGWVLTPLRTMLLFVANSGEIYKLFLFKIIASVSCYGISFSDYQGLITPDISSEYLNIMT